MNKNAPRPIPVHIILFALAFALMAGIALLAPLLITRLDGLPPEQVPDKIQGLLFWAFLPLMLGGLWLAVQGVRILAEGRFPISGMLVLHRTTSEVLTGAQARLRGGLLLILGSMLVAAWAYSAFWVPAQLRLWLVD